MPIIKDANYWKEYNQKHKEYLLLKKRQSRAKLKGLVVDHLNNKSVVDIKLETVVDQGLDNLVVDQTREIKVVDMIKVVDQDKNVQPKPEVVKSDKRILQPEPVVKKVSLPPNSNCSLNHYSFAQLFKETSEQVKSDYQQLYSQYPQTARLCINCRTQERNYQIMRQLLADYAKKTKYHCLSCSEPTKRYSEDNKYECFYPHCPFSTDCKKDLNAHEKTH